MGRWKWELEIGGSYQYHIAVSVLLQAVSPLLYSLVISHIADFDMAVEIKGEKDLERDFHI